MNSFNQFNTPAADIKEHRPRKKNT